MVLLRRVIGDALRARRQSQRRTLREVSTAANVSLGYLSEIERGQKEASSELLLAICDALGAAQSEVLRAACDTLALAEMDQILATPMDDHGRPVPGPCKGQRTHDQVGGSADVASVVDGEVAVALHHKTQLRTTLRAASARGGREVVRAA